MNPYVANEGYVVRVPHNPLRFIYLEGPNWANRSVVCLFASASQSSKVTFTANGIAIPGCNNIPTKAGVGLLPATATCGYKAVTLGVVNLVATLTPDDQVSYANTVKTLKITVNPK